MIIILDTNVIIASFATEGLCHALLELCVDQHKIIICKQILNEVTEKLEKELKLPSKIINDITNYLKNISIVKDPPKLLKQFCRDKKDNIILSLAETSKANYIITGDDDLLVLKKYKITPIITLRRFWEILREK